MQLVIMHRNAELLEQGKSSLLSFALDSEPVSKIIFDELKAANSFYRKSRTMFAIPKEWQMAHLENQNEMAYYNGKISLNMKRPNARKSDRWLVVSNGRFVTDFDRTKLGNILDDYDDGLIAIDIDPSLMSYRQKMPVTSDGRVAGFRRLYSDSILPTSIPDDWPAQLFVKFSDIDKILADGLPSNFSTFRSTCQSHGLKWNCFKIGGTVFDLEKEDGLLDFLTAKLNSKPQCSQLLSKSYPGNCKISASVKIFGPVLMGNNVRIDENAILVGPVIIGDNVTIERDAVIKSSLIGKGQLIQQKSFVQNCLLAGEYSENRMFCGDKTEDLKNTTKLINSSDCHFRMWPLFSYVRCFKRIADIIVSLLVLTLFAPFFPIIAVIIKLNSKGPAFFKHRRQGLYGKEFNCLKFRTMIIGADDIQAKLRSQNQVDGPQFKVEDDPRVTVVGRFLRNTFIDEIPQFINVLLGQMSLVGPRPSPKTENSSCPLWRDARLSVRPGITGLWQICRTRLPGQDFQEWIHYDIQYVRNISLILDIAICLRTTKKLVIDFIKQF